MLLTKIVRIEEGKSSCKLILVMLFIIPYVYFLCNRWVQNNDNIHFSGTFSRERLRSLHIKYVSRRCKIIITYIIHGVTQGKDLNPLMLNISVETLILFKKAYLILICFSIYNMYCLI